MLVLLFLVAMPSARADEAVMSLADSTADIATECTHNTGQCPGVGWFCLNGRCVQESTGERCWNHNECPIGSSCVNGVCR